MFVKEQFIVYSEQVLLEKLDRFSMLIQFQLESIQIDVFGMKFKKWIDIS